MTDPTEAAQPPRRGNRWRLVTASAAVVAAVIVGAVVVAGGDASSAPPLRLGAVTVPLPDGWEPGPTDTQATSATGAGGRRITIERVPAETDPAATLATAASASLTVNDVVDPPRQVGVGDGVTAVSIVLESENLWQEYFYFSASGDAYVLVFETRAADYRAAAADFVIAANGLEVLPEPKR